MWSVAKRCIAMIRSGTQITANAPSRLGVVCDAGEELVLLETTNPHLHAVRATCHRETYRHAYLPVHKFSPAHVETRCTRPGFRVGIRVPVATTQAAGAADTTEDAG